jgi:hypothetical protein
LKTKNWKWSDFGKFLITRSEREKSRNGQISIFGLECVSQKYQKTIKELVSYLIYNPVILLNILEDDCHFFYNFLCMIATLATNQKFLNKWNGQRGERKKWWGTQKVATCHVLHLASTLHAIVCGNILQNSNLKK